jgi:outer membrane protein
VRKSAAPLFLIATLALPLAARQAATEVAGSRDPVPPRPSAAAPAPPRPTASAPAVPPSPQSAPPAAAALTLAEAHALALQNHPLLKQAQFAFEASHQVVREARSDYMPTVTADLTGVDAKNDSRIGAGGLNNPIIYSRYANGLTVSQLVTDFGRTQNLVASSRLQSQAASENVEATRQQILLGVDQAYYGVLRADAVLRVAQQTVNERQQVVDQASALEKARLKSGLDLSFAQVNLSQAQLDLVRAQNDLNASYADLATALGLPGGQAFSLAETPTPAPPDPASADRLVAQALLDRPDLQSLRLDTSSAQKFAYAERDLNRPTVSALASAGTVPISGPIASTYAAAGVNVEIPVFNGFLFSARHAEAQSRASAINQQMRNEAYLVERDTRVALLNVETAWRQIGIAQQLLDQANLALNLSQARYNLGLASIVELSQAQLNQTMAEIEQARAKYDYQAQYSQLQFQLGDLH